MKNKEFIASFIKDRRILNKTKRNNPVAKPDELNHKDYKSFTIDFKNIIMSDGCHKALSFLAQILDTEIIYIKENKIKNNQLHVHGYFKSNKSLRVLEKEFYHIFLGHHYDVKDVFHLEGWKNYITKENHELISTHN